MTVSGGSCSTRYTQQNDQVSIEIDPLVLSVTKEMKELDPYSDECCIYRVPLRLRKLNETAYTPQVVSIGPLHHSKKIELKAMERQKWMYLQEFLELSKVSVHNFITCIRKNETRLRNCYEEALEFSSEIFVKMMLVDAAFTTMVLLKHSFKELRSKNDRLYHKPWMINDVKFDMILLENQIPFFILEKFFQLFNTGQRRVNRTLIELTYHFLSDPCRSWVTDSSKVFRPSDVEHFVDFLRLCQKPLKPPEPKHLDSLAIPTALELHQAGVMFECRSSQRLLDMEFQKGTLEIPRVYLNYGTEILLRNIQALEQRHCKERYLGEYIFMINSLVVTTKDVELLIKNGIIDNWLADTDEVLSLVHNLIKGNYIDTEKLNFSHIIEDLNKYSKRRKNKWQATLKQDYFHSPWAIISFVAAAILLVLTVIQAVCSIIQVA